MIRRCDTHFFSPNFQREVLFARKMISDLLFEQKTTAGDAFTEIIYFH